MEQRGVKHIKTTILGDCKKPFVNYCKFSIKGTERLGNSIFWSIGIKSFPILYDTPILFRHAIYLCKAPDLNLMDMNEGSFVKGENIADVNSWQMG